MSTGIGHFEREDLVNLFARLHLQRQRLVIGRQQSARAFIQGKRCIDELAAILQQIVDAVDPIDVSSPQVNAMTTSRRGLKLRSCFSRIIRSRNTAAIDLSSAEPRP